MELASMSSGHPSRIRRMLARTLECVLPLVVVAAVSGCTPYSTYPPDDTGEALVPWMYPMPQLMSKSLRTTYDKTVAGLDTADGTPTLVFALPADISGGVWDQVGVDTGVDGARPMVLEDVELGTPVWAIEQIRVRNLRAEVDVIFPVRTGYERATVILESEPFRPFEVAFFQRWRVPVEAPGFTGMAIVTEDTVETAEVIEDDSAGETIVEGVEDVEESTADAVGEEFDAL